MSDRVNKDDRPQDPQGLEEASARAPGADPGDASAAPSAEPSEDGRQASAHDKAGAKIRGRWGARSLTPEARELGRKFLSIGRLALLAGILVAVGLVSGIIGMQLAIRGDDVATPELIGKPLAQAEEGLKAARLQMAVISQHYDDSVEEGSIISQTPSPGTRVKPGQKVRVIVSRGVRKEPVPELVGETLRSAGAKLVETDYRLGVVSEVLLESVEDGRVVKQYPEAGSEKSGGTQIDLLVARSWAASFVMPDILGERLSNVLLLFERRGLSIGEIRYRPQRGTRRGTILRQYPEPGGRLSATDRINVEVASRWR